jgi:diguanylate cyclase (GGDEF)-like protein/PAS domain S-box-containing protein
MTDQIQTLVKPEKFNATVYALLNATSDLALIIDTDGIILEVSESTTARVGKTRDQLVGTCIYDYFKPEMVDFRKAYVQLVTQGRQMIRFEDHYEDLTFLVGIYPIINDNDDVNELAVFVADVTELKRNEMLLHRFSQILATINDPIAYIDKNFRYQTVNEAMMTIYRKKKKQEMVGHPVEKIVGKEAFQKQFRPFILQCLGGGIVYNQDWFDFPDGQRRYMYMSFYPLFAKDNVVSGAVLNSIDITKIKEMEDQLKLLSQTDQLTQIFNRVKFNDSLTREIHRAKRYGTELTLIMLDIDHFKRINDTYGHNVGDDVLVNLSELVKTCIRETDIFARWGGEEFMLLLPHTTLLNASKLAERIRAAVEKNNFLTVGTVTSSFGVTQYVNTDTAETFTKRVDRALYKAKQSGRNRVIAAQAKEKD